jgi:glycosyltransferase involved in cell wall biosynthesis
MSTTFFYRSLKCGFSIKKVFNTISIEISKSHEVREYYVPSHHAGLWSVLKNIIYVFKHRNKRGINHITGDIHYCALALIGCKSVLTIHDLSALEGAQNPIKRAIIKWLWFKIPLLIVNKVVCISEHTRNDLMKITNRKDIKVIYNAVDPAFINSLKPFNTQKPVILQIGTAWNKNVLNTIKAIASLDCHMVIIGQVDTIISGLLKENNISYAIKTRLTDLELIEEYIQCDIVSFCSLYEGFGMPIIEGNAIGRCVITSAISPMTEIASNAACFVDPNDTQSIKNGFSKIISDADFRDLLINNGLSNINRFNVVDISKSYIKLYTTLQC